MIDLVVARGKINNPWKWSFVLVLMPFEGCDFVLWGQWDGNKTSLSHSYSRNAVTRIDKDHP